MKRLKKLERKETNYTEPVKRILIVYFFLFLGFVLIFPNKFANIVTDQGMIFQFHGSAADWGMSGEADVHGAADKWKYLFDNTEVNDKVFTGTLVSTQTISNISGIPIVQTNKYVKIVKGSITLIIPDYYVAIDKNIFNYATIKFYLENYLEGSRQLVSTSGQTFENCVTLWGETVSHGDFIIAYQQREDVDTICNVEKRYCNDGVLNGSYTGQSCKENITYEYERIQPISYNQPVTNEFIQPTEPENANATFSSQGKISGTLEANTTWESQPANAIIVTNKEISLTQIKFPDCKTPWGEKVKNGQFVKAYKDSKGYVNQPCEIELRICVDGKLKGTYKNKSCACTDMAIDDTKKPPQIISF